MVNDKIKVSTENEECFDKKQIAVAIRNSTFDDRLECSLIEEGILRDCEGCSLKFICEGIEKLAEDYIDSTTKVINTFDFNN